MLVAKSFLITGSTIHRTGADGQVGPQKEIADKVDAAINKFLGELSAGSTLVDIKPNVQIGTTQDHAFITIIVDVPEAENDAPSAKAGRPKKG